jgi:hypothetical protein
MLTETVPEPTPKAEYSTQTLEGSRPGTSFGPVPAGLPFIATFLMAVKLGPVESQVPAGVVLTVPAGVVAACVAAKRALRLVHSTNALRVKKRRPPAITTTSIKKKKEAVKANSRVATPRSAVLIVRVFIRQIILIQPHGM